MYGEGKEDVLGKACSSQKIKNDRRLAIVVVWKKKIEDTKKDAEFTTHSQPCILLWEDI